jgi:hypothetical protein
MKNFHKIALISLFSIIAVVFRLIPHPENMTPLVALALLSGLIFGSSSVAAIVFPLVAMLVSDFVLGFHPVSVFVYGAMVLTPLFSRFVRERSFFSLTYVTLGSSFSFFVITNFGHWMLTEMYQKTWTGLIECYVAAIPFLFKSAAGDLMFASGFVGMLWILRTRAGSQEGIATSYSGVAEGQKPSDIYRSA